MASFNFLYLVSEKIATGMSSISLQGYEQSLETPFQPNRRFTISLDCVLVVEEDTGAVTDSQENIKNNIVAFKMWLKENRNQVFNISTETELYPIPVKIASPTIDIANPNYDGIYRIAFDVVEILS